jgi:ABC-type proline/glycine betaine transport system ATPase subunit
MGLSGSGKSSRCDCLSAADESHARTDFGAGARRGNDECPANCWNCAANKVAWVISNFGLVPHRRVLE